MKMDLSYRTALIFTAALALTAVPFSCQKHYDMVPPPAVQEDDDLDDEIFGDAEDYFVSLYGDGEMDGSSWENALDEAGLIDLLTGTENLSECHIHVCEGTYHLSLTANTSITVKKNVAGIFGGYSDQSQGTSTETRDPEKYQTIFSGDLNENGTADEGDCGLMTINSGHVKIDGVIFQHGYISENTALAQTSGSGFFIDGDAATTILELSDCIVRDCVHGATSSHSVEAGGAAIRIMTGQARLKNVQLTGNHSDNRGGAIRCCEQGSILMLDRCLINDNDITNQWGSGIQLSSGNACLNNTSIFGNTTDKLAQSGQINGGAAMLIVNSTIIGEDSETYVVRCESPAGSTTRFINNVFLSKDGTGTGFCLNGNSFEATSFGFNLYNKVSGVTMLASDRQYTGNFADLCSYDEQENVFKWTADAAGLSGFATAAAVTEAVRGFNPSTCPVANLGNVFADWCTEAAFSVDARGSARNPEKFQPGAYDAGLE